MRQLAAILFADMTGYTALMQENEHLARLKGKRLKEVLELTITNFRNHLFVSIPSPMKASPFGIVMS